MNTIVAKAPPRKRRTDRGVLAQQFFFPAAALFAAVAPWLLLGSLYGWFYTQIDIITHSRSMLFGYVGALIAGYLGGKLPKRQMAVLFGLWLAGRIAEVCSSEPFLVNLLYAAFGLYLAVTVVPRFRAAKKWRNRLIAPLLALITCFPIILWIANAGGWRTNLSLHSLVLLISLLMFFMGGRFITPLLARAYANQGGSLPQRVQPHLEGVVMCLLILASTFSIFHAASVWVAAATGLSGVLLLVRLYRWQLFALGWMHADLLALGSGYLWLGVGLLVLSYSLVGGLPTTASLHIITIGALGTLSTSIMLKLSNRASGQSAAAYYAIVLLLSVATISRFLVDYLPMWRQPLLLISALMWSANFSMAAFTILVQKR